MPSCLITPSFQKLFHLHCKWWNQSKQNQGEEIGSPVAITNTKQNIKHTVQCAMVMSFKIVVGLHDALYFTEQNYTINSICNMPLVPWCTLPTSLSYLIEKTFFWSTLKQSNQQDWYKDVVSVKCQLPSHPFPHWICLIWFFAMVQLAASQSLSMAGLLHFTLHCSNPYSVRTAGAPCDTTTFCLCAKPLHKNAHHEQSLVNVQFQIVVAAIMLSWLSGHRPLL